MLARRAYVCCTFDSDTLCSLVVRELSKLKVDVWRQTFAAVRIDDGQDVSFRQLEQRPIFIAVLSTKLLVPGRMARTIAHAIKLKQAQPHRILVAILPHGHQWSTEFAEFVSLATTVTEQRDQRVYSHLLREALSIEDTLVSFNDKDPEDVWEQGKLLMLREEFYEALEHFRRASELEPTNPKYWNSCGLALVQLRRYEDALKAYDHALKLNPRFAFAHTNKGACLEGMTRYDEALIAYEQAISADGYYNTAWDGKRRLLTMREP